MFESFVENYYFFFIFFDKKSIYYLAGYPVSGKIISWISGGLISINPSKIFEHSIYTFSLSVVYPLINICMGNFQSITKNLQYF